MIASNPRTMLFPHDFATWSNSCKSKLSERPPSSSTCTGHSMPSCSSPSDLVLPEYPEKKKIDALVPRIRSLRNGRDSVDDIGFLRLVVRQRFEVFLIGLELVLQIIVHLSCILHSRTKGLVVWIAVYADDHSMGRRDDDLWTLESRNPGMMSVRKRRLEAAGGITLSSLHGYDVLFVGCQVCVEFCGHILVLTVYLLWPSKTVEVNHYWKAAAFRSKHWWWIL